jgi:hypothetical protein
VMDRNGKDSSFSTPAAPQLQQDAGGDHCFDGCGRHDNDTNDCMNDHRDEDDMNKASVNSLSLDLRACTFEANPRRSHSSRNLAGHTLTTTRQRLCAHAAILDSQPLAITTQCRGLTQVTSKFCRCNTSKCCSCGENSSSPTISHNLGTVV